MATTVSYGKCATCGESNAMVLSECRKCGAPLPWAKNKAPKVKVAQSAASVAHRQASSFDWGTLGVGVFSFFIPIIGYFLYRSYSNNGDEKAGAALIGAVLGVLFHVGRIALRAAT